MHKEYHKWLNKDTDAKKALRACEKKHHIPTAKAIKAMKTSK